MICSTVYVVFGLHAVFLLIAVLMVVQDTLCIGIDIDS